MADRTNSLKRRDFLAGVGAAGLAGLLQLPHRVAVAAPGRKTAPDGARVHRIGIYPAIGICRVGGSDKYFLAPEIPGVPPAPDGGFKDGDQSIKKQAQRFRLYAFDKKGRLIEEVTAKKATITWTVHLANAKAAWYGFNNPLDNSELAPGLPGQRRNPYFVADEEREQQLVIDGGKRTLSAASAKSKPFAGRFFGQAGTDVELGHLETDEVGRLVVVPPDGISSSPTGAPITSFADNNGWHDDWCDGPVRATVRYPDGKTFEADTAWVACVGPNFAPEIPPVSTLYDVISDMNEAVGWTAPIPRPLSFVKHIYPTFQRLGLMKWVSSAANLRQGWLDVGDFTDPAYIARLADPSPGNEALRRSIFGKLRDPHRTGGQAYREQRLKMPMMLGEGVNYDGSPLQWFQFPKRQYELLRSWAEGRFVNDLSDPTPTIRSLDDLPLEVRPDALTQAALEPCSGGAFHPGVELTYYLRLPQMYARHTDKTAEPFRLAFAERDRIGQNLGRLLTHDKAMHGDKTLGTPPPIGPQGAGDLTRWMGLPWQCDAFSCQQVLMQSDFPTAVWWPALLPIDVLPEAYYDKMMDEHLSADARIKFFESRVDWKRGVAGIGYHANASYWDGITSMIALWERMGFVVKRPGLPGAKGALAAIPDEVYVETGRGNVEKRFDWSPDSGDVPE